MGKKKQHADQSYRSRIKEFKPECPTALLKPHPQNWRLHPEQQKDLLRGMLGSIGKIDAILAYESEKHGGLIIIDGHQRQELDATYPVIVLDVNDDEATKILMTYNPIADLATQDHEAYRGLLATIEAEDLRQSKELAMIAQSVLGEQVTSAKAEDVVLKRIDVKAPPERIWVVVGVPVNEFGVINSIVEQLQSVPNVIVEMTPSDWMPKKDDE
jgi:hypothetical protein